MRKQLLISFLVAIVMINMQPLACYAQNISTIAGCGIGDDSLATRAELVGPVGITFDTAGNAYIADAGSFRVRKVSATGVITTIAGNGVYGLSGDGGPATAASIGVIYGIATDRNGNIYMVDNGNNCIRKINAAGIISTIAGTGNLGFSGDNGPATAATLYSPIDIVLDTAGNVIFTDWGNDRVRKINTSGIITTIVGTGNVNGTGNGVPATASSLGDPFRVTMDRAGNLYVAEVVYQYICKVDTAGIINVIAGTGAYATGTDGDGGPATAATMTSPCGLAVDTLGNLYFSDIGNGRIRKVDMNTGIISNYAANGVAGYSGDGGPATAAQVSTPEGLACDTAGNVFICDADNNRIRKVAAGNISTFAGQNGLFGEGYGATNAEICLPANIVTDVAGNVYFADTYNNRIRKLNITTGTITTVAGCGIAGYDDGYSGDNGPATAAHIYNPTGVAIDSAGNIYIADANNQRIRKVNTSGIITTIAGNGTAGYNGNNISAVSAELNNPSGVAVDNAGNVYIADEANNRIRKVNTSGILTTIAGAAQGYSGDGGPATAAQLYYPIDVTVDGLGNLYISDYGNSSIRKIDTTGTINTVAGTGDPGFTGDGGDAVFADLAYPTSVKADKAGNILIADIGNERVRWVNASGIINTVAGVGTRGFSGDGGLAVNAELNNPYGVAIGASGSVYISDENNFRIRKLTLPLSVSVINGPGLADIYVYPNPTNGVTNIVNATNANIVVRDVLGNEVMKRSISSAKESLDISNLANGIYMLEITYNSGEKKVIKIVKE